ncbi:MAG: polysaccharide deacetylase [Selenomonadaceae bacterium]|nr:polysaccharide deacetylase [Selenomonadaceae bacterium]
MRKILSMLALLALALTMVGCDEYQQQPLKPAEPVEPAPVVESYPPPTNVMIANDDFSNLYELDNVVTPVYDQYTIWERQEKGLPMELPYLEPYTWEKIAYLTFDDGPDDKNTPAVLDILKQEGILGTFYVVGTQIEQYPEVLKRIYSEGHAIGNHSYTHKYNELYPTASNFLIQLTNTDDLIYEIIGVRPLIIRAPGGRAGMWTADYPPMMQACGYVEHDWNLSCEDAAAAVKLTAPEMVAIIEKQLDRGVKNDAAIVLLHCNSGKEETVAALPDIIRVLRERGFSFGVVTPITPQPW